MESAETVQPIVDQWLASHASQDDWFLHVNYWDPHTPYQVPLEYRNPFANDPLPAWLDNEEFIERHNHLVGPHSSREINLYDDSENPRFPRHPGSIRSLAELRRMIDRYDTGIRYVDYQIAKIVTSLQTSGVYDDTMIIISADHGENQGELGIYGEHATADDATCRLPLILKFPGGIAGIRDPGLHYNIDLVPTLMDLLGGKKQPLWDGTSFASTIREGAKTGREHLIISQCVHVCQRAVCWDDWLYIRTYHDGFHLFPREMLFDLKTDPHEQNDLAATSAGICQEGAWRLARWHDDQMQRMAQQASDVVDPLRTVLKEGGPFHSRLSGENPGEPCIAGFRKYLTHLESTGREEQAISLHQKYQHYLPAGF